MTVLRSIAATRSLLAGNGAVRNEVLVFLQVETLCLIRSRVVFSGGRPRGLSVHDPLSLEGAGPGTLPGQRVLNIGVIIPQAGKNLTAK